MNPTVEAWFAAIGVLTVYLVVSYAFIRFSGWLGMRRRDHKQRRMS